MVLFPGKDFMLTLYIEVDCPHMHLNSTLTIILIRHDIPDSVWLENKNAGYLKLQIHTLRLCNSHCFSTTTMVARTSLNVTLYVHYLSS